MFELLCETAIGALIHTWLVLLIGGIILNFLGGLLQDMTPTLPPGLKESSTGKAATAALWKPWSWAQSHTFWIVFGFLFTITTVSRLTHRTGSEPAGARATRVQKVLKNLSENWAGLLLGNAFGAFIAATVLMILQKFSWTQILLGWVLETVLPPMQAATTRLFGPEPVEAVTGWISWYGENQLRFNFWALYVASVCDDLGLPNLKSLCRFLWRRWQKRAGAGAAATTDKVQD